MSNHSVLCYILGFFLQLLLGVMESNGAVQCRKVSHVHIGGPQSFVQCAPFSLTFP